VVYINNLVYALNSLKNLIEALLFIRLLLSYINYNFTSFIGSIIYELTEPILSLARNLIDKLGINFGMFDFSYIFAFLILRIIYIAILYLIGVM